MSMSNVSLFLIPVLDIATLSAKFNRDYLKELHLAPSYSRSVELKALLEPKSNSKHKAEAAPTARIPINHTHSAETVVFCGRNAAEKLRNSELRDLKLAAFKANFLLNAKMLVSEWGSRTAKLQGAAEGLE